MAVDSEGKVDEEEKGDEVEKMDKEEKAVMVGVAVFWRVQVWGNKIVVGDPGYLLHLRDPD